MSEGDVTKFAEAFNRSQEAKENGIRRLIAENQALLDYVKTLARALEKILWLCQSDAGLREVMDNIKNIARGAIVASRKAGAETTMEIANGKKATT